VVVQEAGAAEGVLRREVRLVPVQEGVEGGQAHRARAEGVAHGLAEQEVERAVEQPRVAQLLFGRADQFAEHPGIGLDAAGDDAHVGPEVKRWAVGVVEAQAVEVHVTQPEADAAQQVVAHGGVIDVELGQVRHVEVGHVLIGPVLPVVPAIVGAVAVSQRGLEGGVLAAPVVAHEIEQQADAALVALVHQFAHVIERAQPRVDGEVVAGVVAVVGVVREERIEPEGCEAQPGDVGQVVDDAAQRAAIDVGQVRRRVPGAAVAGRKTVGEDLVDDGRQRPGRRAGVADNVAVLRPLVDPVCLAAVFVVGANLVAYEGAGRVGG